MDFLIFGISIVGGMVGALVGGNNLIILPALILSGVPAEIAIGSSRCGAIGMPLAAMHSFHRKKSVNYKVALIVAVPLLLGGLIGAQFVNALNETLLKKIIGLSLIILTIVTLVKPTLGTVSKTKAPSSDWLGAGTSLAVGFAAGLIGAGASTGITYILIAFFGQNFLESAANSKLALLLFSLFLTAIFWAYGMVDLSLALTIFAGISIGSYLAAHHANLIGNRGVRWLFIVVSSLMAAKLMI